MPTVKKIMSIPRPNDSSEDSWVWIPNDNGVYTVKSGYHTATNLRLGLPPSALNEQNRKHWKKIWSAKVPAKVKFFMWRTCRGVLPVRTRLQDKRVPCPAVCPFCNTADETTLHLFKDCDFSRAV